MRDTYRRTHAAGVVHGSVYPECLVNRPDGTYGLRYWGAATFQDQVAYFERDLKEETGQVERIYAKIVADIEREEQEQAGTMEQRGAEGEAQLVASGSGSSGK